MILEDQIALRVGRTLTSDEIELIKRMNGLGTNEDEIVETLLLNVDVMEGQEPGYVSVRPDTVQRIEKLPDGGASVLPPVEN